MIKPLVDIDALRGEVAERKGIAPLFAFDKALPLVSENSEELRALIPSLVPEKGYTMWTEGKWHLHDLILHLSSYAGPSELFISSWTVTEEPARMLVSMKEKGLLTKIHCLFDYRINDRKPKPLQLLLSNCDTHAFTKIHAKCFVLYNSLHPVCYMGSANLSKNPRNEVGVVLTHRDVCEFHTNYLREKINGNKQPTALLREDRTGID